MRGRSSTASATARHSITGLVSACFPITVNIVDQQELVLTRLLMACATVVGLSCLSTAGLAQTADQFGQVLDGMGLSGPPLMTYTCRLSGNQVLGLPVIIGREQFQTVSITIAEDAAASVNGAVLEPRHIQYADNGDVNGVIYNARDFQQAMAGNVSAELFGMTGEEKQAFERLKSLMNGSVDQAMGERRRFVSILLHQDTIGFFDLDANNRPANQTVGNCTRGM